MKNPPIDISSVIAPMLATHQSGVNESYAWRIQQITSLEKMLKDNWQDFIQALYTDLHKVQTEAEYSELVILLNEIKAWKKNLKKWMRPERVATPGILIPTTCEIRSRPLRPPGCLIIAPFNYPVLLSLLPAIGCLGAGNPVVLKPSELCPTVSSLIMKLIPKYFEKGIFQVIEGGVAETSELLKTEWGLIFFTGSERVGKIVAEAAAKTLTPTILELGGKSPTYVSQDCPNDMKVICDRIAWAKLVNAGQTCVAPDYILCHETKLDEFSRGIVESMERMFTRDNQKDSELPRIVSVSHSQRLFDAIVEAESKFPDALCYGGSKRCQVSEKLISPTVFLNLPLDCQLMKEEIFGPILPIITVTSDEEAIRFINQMPGTPLTINVFTKSTRRFNDILSRCPVGTACRNDALVIFGIGTLPFGGLGTSGIGRYKGKFSYDSFSHKLAVASRPCRSAFEFFGIRYHPHGNSWYYSRAFPLLFKTLPNIPSIHFGFVLGATVFIAATAIALNFALGFYLHSSKLK